MFALVEAARFIGANSVLQSAKGKLGFEGPLEFGGPSRVAASARMSLGTLIAAYEYVFCESCHGGRVEKQKRAARSGPPIVEL